MKGRRHKKADAGEDLGTHELECPACKTRFEWRWTEIFDLQEMTHGYVGFELQSEFIACPKCGSNANVESAYTYGPASADDEDDDSPF